MNSAGSIKTQYVGGDTVSVLLPLPLAGAYDYRVPEGAILKAGAFVTVPLGRRRTVGVIWGKGAGGGGGRGQSRGRGGEARAEGYRWNPPRPAFPRGFPPLHRLGRRLHARAG